VLRHDNLAGNEASVLSELAFSSVDVFKCHGWPRGALLLEPLIKYMQHPVFGAGDRQDVPAEDSKRHVKLEAHRV
jgi:hypothetical protein